MRLIARGTIEEQILACADRKMRLDHAVSTGDPNASADGPLASGGGAGQGER